MRGAILASLLAPLLILGFVAIGTYARAFAEAERKAAATADVLHEHALKVLQTSETLIKLIDSHFRGRPWEELGSEEAHRYLNTLETNVDHIGSLWLAGPDGVTRNNSRLYPPPPIDVSDREYFQELRAADATHVSRSMVGRLTGDVVFNMARRRGAGGDAFDGLIIAFMNVDYFISFYAGVATDEGATAALVRTDGEVLARYPVLAQRARLGAEGVVRGAAAASQGTFRKVSQTDGIERIYAFRRLADYPVVVTYGTSTKTVLRQWLRDMAVYLAVALLAAAVLASVSGGLVRRARQEHDFRARLEQAVAERTEQLSAALSAEAEARRQAEAAKDSKVRFFAAASHDLRQPMQAIRLYLDALHHALEGQPTRRMAEMAGVALSAGEELLGALLDNSALEAGSVKARPAPVALDEVLSKLAIECAPQASSAGLTLAVRPTSLWVVSDQVLLERMLRNLIHNALRYTDEGGVLVGCRRRGATVAIEVWDTGIGIPAEEQALIFEDFFRISGAERGRGRGLGLGLSTVARMAELLGHRVTVRSRPGRGSVFTVLAEAAEPQGPALAEAV